MKNCPVCNELLGDNVEVCYKCKYEFNKKIYVCNKCGQRLFDATSSCACGGWAISQADLDETPPSFYAWSRSELKEKAKGRLSSILTLAAVVCLILSISAVLNTKITTPKAYYTLNELGRRTLVYYDNTVSDYINIDSVKHIPSWLNVRIGWLTVPILKNTRFNISIAYLYITLITTILSILIYNPYRVGVNRFFMRNIYADTDLKSAFFGFRNYLPVTGKMFIMDLKIFLWSLLLIIPGIVKYYEYMMVPYILSENPHIKTSKAFEISKDIMTGNKWYAFVLDLSFFWWRLLSIVTLGIAEVVWVTPYIQATKAELYAYFRRCFHPNSQPELIGFENE